MVVKTPAHAALETAHLALHEVSTISKHSRATQQGIDRMAKVVTANVRRAAALPKW